MSKLPKRKAKSLPKERFCKLKESANNCLGSRSKEKN